MPFRFHRLLPHTGRSSVRFFLSCAMKRRPGWGSWLWFVSGICHISNACTTMFSARAADLDQLEQIAGTYATRGSFLTELTLDPPQATSAEAGSPHLDEDYLVLSTIHSA